MKNRKNNTFSPSNAILALLETTGAGSATKKQDRLSHLSGVEASYKMAKTDASRINRYAALFIEVGKEINVPPALLAAIASRESRGGSALSADGTGDHGNGFGIMQIDKRYHDISGTYNGKEHIAQAAAILKKYWRRVARIHPNWTNSEQLRGAVAAYNFGVKNVKTIERLDIGTTGNDYSSDVWARANYYAALRTFQEVPPKPTFSNEKWNFIKLTIHNIYETIKRIGFR